jgi:hypothetical protein
MRKEFAIVAVIAVIMVSAAVAITVANMSDAQGNVQRYEINDLKTYFYDSMIAQSTISSSQADATESEISYDDGNAEHGYTIDLFDIGHAVFIAYFNTTSEWTEIDIPDINITSDFYVCFFERGSIYVGADTGNPEMKSYVVIRDPKGMIKEEKLNWMIRAVGA